MSEWKCMDDWKKINELIKTNKLKLLFKKYVKHVDMYLKRIMSLNLYFVHNKIFI